MNLRIAASLFTALFVTVFSATLTFAQTNEAERAFEAEFERAYQFQRQGQFKQAAAMYEVALQRFPEASNSPNAVSLLNNLGFLLIGSGRLDDAERLFTTALELQTRRTGPLDRPALRALQGLVLVAGEQHDWQMAGKRLADLLDRSTKVFGRESTAVSDVLIQQAMNVNIQLQREQAARLLAEAIHILEKLNGPHDQSLVQPLTSMAIIQTNLGQFVEADRSIMRAISVTESARNDSERGDKLTMIYSALAELRLRSGHYTECEAAYRMLIEIQSRIADQRPWMASKALELASLYVGMGLYDKSEAALRQSAAYAERFGAKSPAFPTLLALAWGRLYSARGQYDDAEKAMLLARDRNRELTQTSSQFDMMILDNLASMYRNAGRFAEAEQTAREVVKTLETRLPPDHPHLARAQFQLGIILLGANKLAEAHQWCERAVAAERVKLEPTHPDLLDHLSVLAKIAAMQNRWDDAIALADEGRRNARRYVHDELPALPPAEQRAFLFQRDGWSLTNALSMSVARPDDVRLRSRGAEWLLNAKGVAQQALAERTIEARTATDPQAAALLEQMQLVSRQRMDLNGQTATSEGDSDASNAKLQALSARESQLAAEFARLAGLTYRADPWIELDELRGKLTADSVLVEVSKTQILAFDDSGPETPASHYVAWIVPPAGAGEVQMVDLGLADKLELAVQAAREVLEKSPQQIETIGRVGAERAVRKSLAALAELVLKPILERIGNVERIELSPDGDLWLIPWVALPLEDGRYAIEKYDIRYQVSGRELADSRAEVSVGAPIVFADPDFDLTSAEVLVATQSVLRKTLVATRGEIGGDTRGLHVNRLPGTAREAEAIAPSLKTLTKEVPVVYTDRWALEGVFKAVKRPRVLVASTHGFFLRDQDIPLQAGSAAVGGQQSMLPLTQSGDAVQNPLARCGLLLAGCNHADQPGQADDGILTGMEIVGTDLRGTELVVLSACQTALGDLHRGEGVSGLRQAFQLAGAQAVIATLWQIDDAETAELMGELFANLAAGQSKSQALRTAQLKRMAASRAEDYTAHPYYWAPFTLTGK